MASMLNNPDLLRQSMQVARHTPAPSTFFLVSPSRMYVLCAGSFVTRHQMAANPDMMREVKLTHSPLHTPLKTHTHTQKQTHRSTHMNTQSTRPKQMQRTADRQMSNIEAHPEGSVLFRPHFIPLCIHRLVPA